MSQIDSNSANNQNSDIFDVIMGDLTHMDDMGPGERRLAILRFMDEHGLALKPKAIYRNLRFHHRILFGDETVKNILHEHVEDGYLRRVEPSALEEDAELVDVERGEGRGAYIITDEGREHIRD